MPRKKYLSDLKDAQNGNEFSNIVDIVPGDETGHFSFLFTGSTHAPVSISVLIPEVSEYPHAHSYLIFAGEKAPPEVAAVLEDLPSTQEKSINQVLEILSRALLRALPDQDGDVYMSDSQVEQNSEEESDGYDAYSEDDWGFEAGPAPLQGSVTSQSTGNPIPPNGLSKLRSRAKLDLRAAKEAGFKVGVHGRIMDGQPCYVSISCRVAKLGVSDEAMRAWELDKNEYLVLWLHYPYGYVSLDDLTEYQISYHARGKVEMRVGKCITYKPSYVDALRAFNTISREEFRESQKLNQQENATGFRSIFISKPLNQLLNERLLAILKYRQRGMMWDGAEAYYDDYQAAFSSEGNFLDEKYTRKDTMKSNMSDLLAHDHMLEKEKDHSLPLAAMEFLLRHVVRCTEFCLVCHCKLKDDLQAIKPYVCDRPLCLYQYMALGFGPSLEHEIITQPHVVDLLVSFCYSRASVQRLRDFPIGLNLTVPSYHPNEDIYTSPYGSSNHSYMTPARELELMRESQSQDGPTVHLNEGKKQMIFEPGTTCPVKKGDWIIISPPSTFGSPVHCRVADADGYPVVKLSQLIPRAVPLKSNPYTTPNSSVSKKQSGPVAPEKPAPKKATSAEVPEEVPISFVKYDQNFDDLTDPEKCKAICQMLDTLPTVSQMREFLTERPDVELKVWADRISPTALCILRWIVASNRACIVQVDKITSGADQKEASIIQSVEERVHGMDNWVQFRFAMGAPDKEKRFRNSVESTAHRLHLQHPTLFAWHGSPLYNWHSIIREGLNFSETLHGRAFGHGCYHSLDYGTSSGYAMRGTSGYDQNAWARSELQINAALSLNEIVNAPEEFVSSQPHLVVAQLDWIQTRYLFVQCQCPLQTDQGQKPSVVCEQDPMMTPRGVSSKLIIPAAAILRSRRLVAGKKGKMLTMDKGTPSGDMLIGGDLEFDDDTASVMTLAEDLDILQDDPGSVTDNDGKASGHSKPQKPSDIMDFKPGQLSTTSLPLLPEPSYATPSATKRLQQDLRTLLKVQDAHAPWELGWSLDPSLLDDNLYQWIIQLHSFPTTLPLASDLVRAGLDSVILELRFPANYPLAPPFVRVLRPRFRPFIAGGGGHVTAGGALCMELLTNSGWSPANSVEAVLVQVRMALMSEEPRPARLEGAGSSLGRHTFLGGDYGEGEALDAYVRACKAHDWEVPSGLREMMLGMQGGGSRS
ncbi:MAG: hypothetical protein M1821_002647 [Bathelium mastoideum]|nr:MAG: hypothetical protein M1821_002647 [Bathelium mastoideum]